MLKGPGGGGLSGWYGARALLRPTTTALDLLLPATPARRPAAGVCCGVIERRAESALGLLSMPLPSGVYFPLWPKEGGRPGAPCAAELPAERGPAVATVAAVALLAAALGPAPEVAAVCGAAACLPP